MNELVSIVVPIYNMGSSIENCVKSLQNQDYKNIEIILVDDGSTDDTFNRCLNIAQQDQRVIALHTDNQGSGPARNCGIEHSNGKYIYFPDADDYLESNAITRLVEAIKYDNCDLVVFGHKNIKSNGEISFLKKYEEKVFNANDLRKSYSNSILIKSKWTIQGAPWNKFFDLDVIRRNNVRYPSLRRHQDEGFIARYMCYATKVHFIEDVLYNYYVNDINQVWKKFPLNYIDAVIGLHEVWKGTILLWNSSDDLTHDLVFKWYVCNVIKSFEIVFSPKHNLTKKQRMQQITLFIDKSQLTEIYTPKSLGKYHLRVLNLAKAGKIKSIYRLVRFKIFLQKSNLIKLIKRK